MTKIDLNRDFNGRIPVRVPKGLHRRLAEEAVSEGVPLNQLILTILAGAVGWEGPTEGRRK